MKSHMTITARMAVIALSLFHLIILSSLIIITRSLEQPNIVKALPGYPGDLPFNLETGYIGVGEMEQVKLFYYFIESERDVLNDPLMIWLTGGPGCSVLSALFFENGPLQFNLTTSKSESDTPKLQINPYSWTKVASIIFLDSPVGTGFSYATTYEGYFSSDTLQSSHINQFLRKWLIKHPKFTQSSLYISGDSYTSMIVPIVVQDILQGNKIGIKPKLNLKGYVIGNPITNLDVDVNAKYKYAHRVSLLSDELYKSAIISCRGDFVNVDENNIKCSKNLQAMNQDIKSISVGYVIGDNCETSSKTNSIVKGKSCWEGNYFLADVWANDKKVRQALYIQEGSIGHWVRCNQSLAYEMDLETTFPYHLNSSRENLQVLVFNGDQDMIAPYIGTRQWIEELNIPISNEWRPWFVDGQVAGYVTEFSHLPYQLVHTTIKGGSHTPSDYNPGECLAMIERWLSLSPL